MRKIPVTVVVWMFALTASAQASAEKSVLDLSKKKFDWLIQKQYDSLAKVLDDNVQYIHSNGWIQNKSEVTGDIKSGNLTYQKIEVKESQVRLYDNAAIVTGRGRFEGTGKGSAFVIDLLYTEVYIKSGNRWKLASRHANKMP
ncbi:MAG: nuclear transport factor 2 family protein [Bacteroidota bacterium]